MTQPIRQSVALLLCALLVVTCGAGEALAQAKPGTSRVPTNPDQKGAERAVERGSTAEAEGRIDDALVAYDEAARYAPNDLTIVGRGAVLRSRLIREHVQKAEMLALAGKVSAAKEELSTAMRIDPTNSTVAERYAEMESMQDDERLPRSTEIAGMPRVKPRSGKQKLDLRGDTRSAYEKVGALFGIRVLMDPDVVSRSVKLELEQVDFNTAVAILGSQTATFWRPIDATTIYVAPDTLEKRRLYGLQAEQTFVLPASAAPEDMTELLRVLREITGATHITLDSRSRTLTMRDSPEALRLAGELIRQLERARGEVMLDIQLLEVDRNKALQLGITPPSSTQAFLITPYDVNAFKGATDLSNAVTILGQLLSAKGLSSIPGFTLLGGGYTRFLLTLPGVAANFSDALSLVQTSNRVLLRAQSGKPATFFVGDRFPVTLSLLSGSLGTGTGTGQTIPSVGVPTSTTFPQTTFGVGNNPSALVSSDFNTDGLPDLAVTNENDNTVSILLNQNDGNFGDATNSPIALPKTETGPIAIGSGILRNNLTNTSGTPITDADLLVVNSTSNNVGVFLGNGDGTFQEAAGSPYTVGKTPSAIAVADFDGDGNLDFAVANTGDNSISVFKGNGRGVFTEFPGSPFALTNTATVAEQGPVALVTGNFRLKTIGTSGLPEVDLAVVNEASNNVSILLGSVDNNGNFTFSEAANSPITVGNTPVAIATGDLNADGIPDLAVVNQADESVSILLGSSNAEGTFNAASGSPLATATTPAGITIASFTGGITPDIAVTNKGQSTLGIYLGLGSGTFSNRIEIGTPVSPGAIISGVFTSSGLPDVASVAQGTTANQGVVAIIQDSATFATGTTPTQTPYPGSEYIDLGVKVKATPLLHANDEVTLQLEFEIRALSGTSINGIPVISNRTITQTVRVKEDETTLISGLLDNQEMRSLTGLPGFANLPGIGYAFGNRNNTSQNTELLILVTPRKLREAIRSGQAIFAGRGENTNRNPGVGAGPQVTQPQP
jgi:type II secretory pathway component GspD/PulD (secretin)/surface antigen